MQIALLGLGNMGMNLALNLQDHGHEVHSWNRSEEKRQQARNSGLNNVHDDIADLFQTLSASNPERKVVWMMVSAGDAVESTLFGADGNPGIIEYLNSGDIVIEGVNSFYRDSQRRAAKLAEKGILMLDCGVSGGISGARHGACVMVGGDKSTYDYVESLFKDVTVEGGYGYFGTSGAGHFVKMVHNAIEYGMMQAIAEGMNLVSKSEFNPDMSQLTSVWNSGSIIQSNLIGFLHQALQKDPGLAQASADIGSLGTGMWASQEALRLGVPLTAITHAVFSRYQSNDKDSLMFKVIQAMRAEFGGHNSQQNLN